MTRLLNNWSLKLMALVLSLALWSHVRGEMNPLETATFTVRLENPSSAMKVFVPETVRVTIRAPRVRLREITGGLPANPLAAPDAAPVIAPRFLVAKLDEDDLQKGARTVSVKIENEIEDAEILGIKPSEITLR